MNTLRDPGSFRDPSGYVFVRGERILRSVNRRAKRDFMAAFDSGVIARLVASGLMIETSVQEMSAEELEQFRGPRDDLPELVLMHPRIPFISYPYEWTFGQLKDAALAHLDLQIKAFDDGFVLSDATPYNMQFYEGRVCHIDVLSLTPYSEGQPWSGYNQFCRLFLLPLLIEAWLGVPFQPMLRGRLDGIDFRDAVRLFPKRKLWFHPNGLIHVFLHERAIARSHRGTPGAAATQASLPKNRYRAILTGLRDWIETLSSCRSHGSSWSDYSTRNSYTDAMNRAKEQFVRSFVEVTRPRVVWDIGGNSGVYSAVALASGAGGAMVFDSDLDALEQAYSRRKAERLDLLPVVMDAADPSPGMGWDQSERRGLNQRRPANLVLGLALVHHLVIGRNLPLRMVINWLIDIAPAGIIEFVPKTDPMVKDMLARREDVFDDYNEPAFRALIGNRAKVVNEYRFAENNRLLIGFTRSHD